MEKYNNAEYEKWFEGATDYPDEFVHPDTVYDLLPGYRMQLMSFNKTFTEGDATATVAVMATPPYVIVQYDEPSHFVEECMEVGRKDLHILRLQLKAITEVNTQAAEHFIYASRNVPHIAAELLSLEKQRNWMEFKIRERHKQSTQRVTPKNN